MFLFEIIYFLKILTWGLRFCFRILFGFSCSKCSAAVLCVLRASTFFWKMFQNLWRTRLSEVSNWQLIKIVILFLFVHIFTLFCQGRVFEIMLYRFFLTSNFQCKYTSHKQSDYCKINGHYIVRHKADKRFFRCRSCSQRTICYELMPTKPCTVSCFLPLFGFRIFIFSLKSKV